MSFFQHVDVGFARRYTTVYIMNRTDIGFGRHLCQFCVICGLEAHVVFPYSKMYSGFVKFYCLGPTVFYHIFLLSSVRTQLQTTHELFEVVVFRRTIEGIYELTQHNAFPKDYYFTNSFVRLVRLLVLRLTLREFRWVKFRLSWLVKLYLSWIWLALDSFIIFCLRRMRGCEYFVFDLDYILI
jgi:hypothetical protein